MADAVATQVLFEDATSYVYKFTDVSDATGETAVAKIDVSTMSALPSGSQPTDVTIDRIIYATDGMAVRVLWDASTDVLAWCVPTNQHGDYDFRSMRPGGLVNNSGSGKTGNILFTTVGASSGDTYTIILAGRKR